MKKRILLPTDFSSNAQNAIHYATSLFKEAVCDFYILNTYHIEAYSIELATAIDFEEYKQKSVSGLSNILKKLSSNATPANHQYHMVSEYGPLVEIMKEIIAKRDIDFVVMGTKGDTDARAQIYGSNTVLAMEHIRSCPILAIPAVATYTEIKQIVFPTGYSMDFKRREFQYLVDIAEISKATIRILHVQKDDEELDGDQLNNKELLKDYFEGLDYTFHTQYNMEVQEALHSFIESHEIDMVVFINKQHHFFTSLFSRRKPMMKALGYYSRIPVLALHDFRS